MHSALVFDIHIQIVLGITSLYRDYFHKESLQCARKLEDHVERHRNEVGEQNEEGEEVEKPVIHRTNRLFQTHFQHCSVVNPRAAAANLWSNPSNTTYQRQCELQKENLRNERVQTRFDPAEFELGDVHVQRKLRETTCVDHHSGHPIAVL